jgi:hypothetical protein
VNIMPGSELIEVRSLAGHDAAMIGADVEPTDIVAHDDEDVRRPLLRSRLGGAGAGAGTCASLVGVSDVVANSAAAAAPNSP